MSRQKAIAMAGVLAEAVKGEVFSIAPTGSMKPTLDEGSVVTVEPVVFADLRRGDIVVYRSATGVPVIHRLHREVGGGWFVLGDNNGSVDAEAVTSRNFIGRVCAIFYTSAGVGDHGKAAVARRE